VRTRKRASRRALAVDAQQPHARRGELNSQRNAIELAGDVDDGREDRLAGSQQAAPLGLQPEIAESQHAKSSPGLEIYRLQNVSGHV
jgi:hypothetical protein